VSKPVGAGKNPKAWDAIMSAPSQLEISKFVRLANPVAGKGRMTEPVVPEQVIGVIAIAAGENNRLANAISAASPSIFLRRFVAPKEVRLPTDDAVFPEFVSQ
jgi:hypothetical protein